MKRYTLPLLLCLPFSLLVAQSSDHYIISAQGGSAKGESMSISWTIGDLVTEAAVMDEGVITQGFQQPILTVKELDVSNHDVFVSNDPKPLAPGIAPRNSDEFTANVFPNPFGSDVTVKIENSKEEYYLDIFDASGNLISRNRSSNPQEVINLGDYPAAQYLLRISLVDSHQSKIFQITKSR